MNELYPRANSPVNSPEEAAITAIRAVPTARGRRAADPDFAVELGGKPWATLTAETIARLGIRTGRLLAPEEREAILFEDATLRARRAAAVRLALRPRSRAELELYLQKKGFAPPIVQAALDRLAESGTLDDRALAVRHIRKRLRQGEYGPARLRHELIGMGVAERDIEAPLGASVAESDPRALCLSLIRRKVGQYQPLADPRNARRFRALLARRGFGSEMVEGCLREAELLDSCAPGE